MAQPVQEIIVYRNPMEKMFWDTAANGEYFPVIAGIVVFFGLLLIGLKLLEKCRWSSWYRNNKVYAKILNILVWWGAGVGGAWTIKYLWI